MFRSFALFVATATIPVFTISCSGPIVLDQNTSPDPRVTAGVDSRNLEVQPRRKPIRVGEPVPRLYFDDQFGREVSTRELTLGGDALLIFYPGAQTPESRPVYQWVQENQSSLSNQLEILLVSNDTSEINLQTSQQENLRLALLSDPNLWCAKTFGLVEEKSPNRLSSTWSIFIGKEDRVLGVRDGFFDKIELLTMKAHRSQGQEDNKALDLLLRD